jgi:hypothetical protein
VKPSAVIRRRVTRRAPVAWVPTAPAGLPHVARGKGRACGGVSCCRPGSGSRRLEAPGLPATASPEPLRTLGFQSNASKPGAKPRPPPLGSPIPAGNLRLLAENLGLLAENLMLLAQKHVDLAENPMLPAQNLMLLAENPLLLAQKHDEALPGQVPPSLRAHTGEWDGPGSSHVPRRGPSSRRLSLGYRPQITRTLLSPLSATTMSPLPSPFRS